jgi:outer membrane murein-binding lipoprotein Lpp
VAVLRALASLAVALPALLLVRPAAAVVLPADSGAVNVRDFGAKGDGVHDDTEAIRAAMRAAQVDQAKVFWPARIVYFPAGTYRVTDTLAKRDAQGRYLSSMSLMGEDRDRVRLRLDDAAPGYAQPAAPKAVIYAASSLLAGSPWAGGKDYLGKGEGNDAYGNYVEDMTVDVGRGNPGAVAIDFIASNVGAIRRVRLVAGEGSGRTALSMERKWPGPLLVSDLAVEGFARGVAVRYREYSVTMENVHLSGQTEAAIRNEGNSLALRGIDIETAATGIVNIGPDGLVVADHVNVRLAGPKAAWAFNRGYLTFKGVRVSGGAGDAALPAGAPPPSRPGAYFGAQRLPGFDAGWRLPAPPPPPEWSPPPSRWASVVQFGAKPDSGEDATAAIRAALRSGAEVVYFPSGRYVISDSIEVPAAVRRIDGMLSSITIERRVPGFARDAGMFRVASAGEPLTIERLALDNAGRGPQLGIEHSGARTLVLRDFIAYAVAALHRRATGGPLFLENTSVGPIRLEGRAGVWARQLNTEGTGVRILNAGAPLSILGLKSEQNSTVVENEAGAQTEVLGGLLYLVNPPRPPRPAFVNRPGARMSVAYAESAYVADNVYREHVVEMGPDGPLRVITADQLPQRGHARIVPGISLPSSPEPGDAPMPGRDAGASEP